MTVVEQLMSLCVSFYFCYLVGSFGFHSCEKQLHAQLVCMEMQSTHCTKFSISNCYKFSGLKEHPFIYYPTMTVGQKSGHSGAHLGFLLRVSQG